MDFNNAKGLFSTAKNIAPTTFIGGTHEIPKGNTAYFTVGFSSRWLRLYYRTNSE